MKETYLRNFLDCYSPGRDVTSVALGVVNIFGNRVLLTEQPEGLGLIAGHKEHGESVLDALMREKREETEKFDLRNVSSMVLECLDASRLFIPPLILRKQEKLGLVFPALIWDPQRVVYTGRVTGDADVRYLSWYPLAVSRSKLRKTEYNSPAIDWLQKLSAQFSVLNRMLQPSLYSYVGIADQANENFIDMTLNQIMRFIGKMTIHQLAWPYVLDI